MEHIRTIQETIDEHKQSMPTGVVTSVMEQCQRLHDVHSNLYRLTWTVVNSHAHVETPDDCDPNDENLVVAKMQNLIVEAVDTLPYNDRGVKMCALDMPNNGMVLASWVKMTLPFCILHGDVILVIIHSIEPYEMRKRDREAFEADFEQA